MKNYKWIIIGVILGICFLIPFFLRGINIQQIEQSISNSEFNTIANYYFSTVAQTMAAIMGFLITSIFAIYPLLSKDKPEYSIIRKFMFGEAILQSIIGIGLGSVVLSIISLLILYIFGNQNFIAFVIISIGVLVSIFVVITIALIIYYLFKYIPLYSDAHEYLEFKNVFKRNDLSETEIIDYVTTCFFIALSKTRYGKSPFTEIIDKQKFVNEENIEKLYNKILTNITNYLYKSGLDEDMKTQAKLFEYICFSNSIELITTNIIDYKKKSKVIIKFLNHFTRYQNHEIRLSVKDMYDQLPNNILSEGSVNGYYNYYGLFEKQDNKIFIRIWLEYIVSLTEFNHFLFMTCFSTFFINFINFPDHVDLELNAIEQDDINTREMHIKVLFRFNIGILKYLKERYCYQNESFNFKIDTNVLLNAFNYNIKIISKFVIDQNIFMNIYSSNDSRKETLSSCNTMLILLGSDLILNDLREKIISQKILTNIDFELFRIIYEIQEHKDLTDDVLFEKVFNRIKEFRTKEDIIQDNMIIDWLNESKRKTLINKKYS